MNFTSKIPTEIFLQILSYLDGDEIFPCLGVCHRWREIINVNAIWKPICVKVRIFDEFPDSTGDIFIKKLLIS